MKNSHWRRIWIFWLLLSPCWYDYSSLWSLISSSLSSLCLYLFFISLVDSPSFGCFNLHWFLCFRIFSLYWLFYSISISFDMVLSLVALLYDGYSLWLFDPLGWLCSQLVWFIFKINFLTSLKLSKLALAYGVVFWVYIIIG